MIFFISLLLHGYLGWRLVPSMPAWPWAQLALGAVLLASAVLIPTTMLTRRLASAPAADALRWVGLTALGAFSSLLVATMLRDAAWLVARLAGAATPPSSPGAR